MNKQINENINYIYHRSLFLYLIFVWCLVQFTTPSVKCLVLLASGGYQERLPHGLSSTEPGGVQGFWGNNQINPDFYVDLLD